MLQRVWDEMMFSSIPQLRQALRPKTQKRAVSRPRMIVEKRTDPSSNVSLIQVIHQHRSLKIHKLVMWNRRLLPSPQREG